MNYTDNKTMPMSDKQFAALCALENAHQRGERWPPNAQIGIQHVEVLHTIAKRKGDRLIERREGINKVSSEWRLTLAGKIALEAERLRRFADHERPERRGGGRAC